MAVSCCPKCGGHSFETVLHTPFGSNFAIQFVQCAHCGCVVGTQEAYNVSSLVLKLAKKLNIEID